MVVVVKNNTLIIPPPQQNSVEIVSCYLELGDRGIV